MAGNREGGIKAAATNKQRYGDEYYTTIGRKGGQISRGGGFGRNHELARQGGRHGGRQSSLSRWGTHCRRGHERTPENVYVSPRGVRLCRPCQRLRQAGGAV